ncbi:MAG TPA: LysR family transcriptional regulator [Planctomycetaceae bacterium]|nr:LysR family transcriptional regulator [Planctomycetaceae bacterium]
MVDILSAGRRPYKELSLQQLRSFCEVCRVGGYAAAARELLLTSPAVWEQLKALEKHFGLVLLERHGNGVRPTLHGERLLELARPLLAGLESTFDVLHQRDGVLPDRLTVVSNLRVLVHEISDALALFRTRYPGERLQISYTGSPEIEALVLEQEADVTLTLEPGAGEPTSPAIAFEPAAELDYLLVTPLHHPLQRAKNIRLEAIVRHPLVLGIPEAYSRHRVHEVLHRHDLLRQMNIAVETSSDEYTLSCVRAGLGVGVTVGNGDGLLYSRLSVRSLKNWFGTARVGFMWRRGAVVAPLQRELADILRASISHRGNGRKRFPRS